MNSPRATAARARPRALWRTTIGLVALAYIVLLGGTGIGDVLPPLGIANAVLAAVLLLRYLVLLPARGDKLDRRILAAVVLFAVAGALSSMPRQSFDSVLMAALCGATLFAARDVLAEPRARRMFVTAAMALSLVMTIAAAARWLPLAWQWWNLAGGDLLPPLNLELNSWPWGHRYDLAFLVVILYPAWWVGATSRVRQLAAASVGLLVVAIVVLVGSRTLWAAAGIASLAVAAPAVLRMWQRSSRGRWILAAIATVAILASIASGVAGALIERGLSAATIDYRTAMWGALLQVWASHPIAGYGPGTFGWLLQTTHYFDTNTWAPLHPDSALFQLVGEAGALGLAAGLIVAGSVLAAVLRSASATARWVTIAFLVMALAANPTVFPFLIAIAIAWVAYAVPHVRPKAAPDAAAAAPVAAATWPRRAVRFASFGAVAVIGVAYVATVLASLAYNGAVFAVRDGNLAAATANLATAVALDPGMALYWRQKGELAYLEGDVSEAIGDLDRATHLNPSDDLGWRSLGLATAAAGNDGGAGQAFGEALARQRSDPTNLLLAAGWLARQGDVPGSSAVLAETVQSWPQIVGASGWTAALPTGVTTADIVDEAAHRWELGLSTPEVAHDQGLWLATMSKRPDLLPAARSAMRPTLAEAEVSLLKCEPADQLAAPTADDRSMATYWRLRFWAAALREQSDETATEMIRIMSGVPSFPGDPNSTLNPLDENGQFSADLWGYHRLPINWPPSDVRLPSSDAGALRWLVDPRGATRDSGLIERLPACE